MGMKNEKLKSCLILVGFLALISICFYRNLESRIKGLYKSNHYPGEIKITSLSLSTQDRLGIDVNYVYSEKVNGKVISIPLKRQMKVEQLVIPYYPEFGKEGHYGMTGDSIGMYAEEYSVYGPILEKSLELNPDSKKLEQEIQNKINQNSRLKGSKISLTFTTSSQLSNYYRNRWLNYYEIESRKKNRTVLGGWYQFPVEDALEGNALYVKISLPKGVDKESIRLKDELTTLLQKTSLPNGIYALDTPTALSTARATIFNGKVKERN